MQTCRKVLSVAVVVLVLVGSWSSAEARKRRRSRRGSKAAAVKAQDRAQAQDKAAATEPTDSADATAPPVEAPADAEDFRAATKPLGSGVTKRAPAAPREDKDVRWSRWGKRIMQREAGLADDTSTSTSPSTNAEDDDAPGESIAMRVPAAPLPRLAVRVSAAGGYGSATSTFMSNGQGRLGRYRITTPLYLAHAHGDVARRIGQRGLEVGARLDYTLARSSTGIAYSDGATEAEIAQTTHSLDLAFGVATRVSGVLLGAHAGYHYAMTNTPKLDNLARLPREALQGVIAGIDVAAPRLLGPVELRLCGDVLLPGLGSFAQTEGLADGSSADAIALWGTLVVSMPATRWLALEARGRAEWTSLSFSGASSRQPDVTSADRTDHALSALLGVSSGF